HNGGFEAFESFDRKLLFYSKWQADEIWRIPIPGGQESLFLKGVEQRYWAVVKGIYFVAIECSEPFVKFIDFAAPGSFMLSLAVPLLWARRHKGGASTPVHAKGGSGAQHATARMKRVDRVFGSENQI